MSRFAVVDKGRINGYATYLAAIGVMTGTAVSSVLNGDLSIGVFYGSIAIGGYILLKRTYDDIEWMQTDFLERQEKYLSEKEFEGHLTDKGFFLPSLQKNAGAEGDT